MTTKTQSTQPTRLPALPPLAQTELRTVHTMGGIVRTALESIDDWRDAAQGIIAIADAPIEPSHPDDAVAVLSGEIIETACAGKPLTADVYARADALTQRHASAQVVINAIDRARGQLINELDNAVRLNWGVLFRALGHELDAIVEQARGLGNLDALKDAETAIARDRVAEFQTWQALISRHEHVRGQQMTLLTKSTINEGITFVEALYFSGAETVHEQWREWHKSGVIVDPLTGAPRPMSAPWPVNDFGHLTVGVVGSPEFLRWSLRHDVHLWVPTAEQLNREINRLQRILIDPAAKKPASDAKTRRAQVANVKARAGWRVPS